MSHDEIRDVVNGLYRAGYRFVLAREVVRELDEVARDREAAS